MLFSDFVCLCWCGEVPVNQVVGEVVAGVAAEAFVQSADCVIAVEAFGYCAGCHFFECHFVSLSLWLLMTLVYRTRHSERKSKHKLF